MAAEYARNYSSWIMTSIFRRSTGISLHTTGWIMHIDMKKLSNSAVLIHVKEGQKPDRPVRLLAGRASLHVTVEIQFAQMLRCGAKG
jgi:hypothetical protein